MYFWWNSIVESKSARIWLFWWKFRRDWSILIRSKMQILTRQQHKTLLKYRQNEWIFWSRSKNRLMKFDSMKKQRKRKQKARCESEIVWFDFVSDEFFFSIDWFFDDVFFFENVRLERSVLHYVSWCEFLLSKIWKIFFFDMHDELDEKFENE